MRTGFRDEDLVDGLAFLISQLKNFFTSFFFLAAGCVFNVCIVTIHFCVVVQACYLIVRSLPSFANMAHHMFCLSLFLCGTAAGIPHDWLPHVEAGDMLYHDTTDHP